jgi:hypothetical protein
MRERVICDARFPVVVSVLTLVSVLPALPDQADRSAAFGWFAPWINLEAKQLREMHGGAILAKTLPASDSEIALFFAGAINADPQAFIEALQSPESLWKMARVPLVTRFSSPPRLEDVNRMRLRANDVEAIRRCRPGDCDVKLTASEIRGLQAAASIQDEFRRMVLDRVTRYLESGFRSTEDFHDHDAPVDPQTVATGLLLRSPWLTERAPRLGEYVENFPATPSSDIDSFLYWLETTHTPKPTIQVVHVMIDRRGDAAAGSPEVLVVSRQVFASHYVNGSLAVSALLTSRAERRRYLTYLTRVHVDGVGGWLSGLKRLLIEGATRRRGAAVFEEQRRRIESFPRSSWSWARFDVAVSV